MDISVDQSRAERETLERAQRLTESHLGLTIAVRHGVLIAVGYADGHSASSSCCGLYR